MTRRDLRLVDAPGDDPGASRALDDPVRRGILERLGHHTELGAQALAALIPVSAPTFAYHAAVLERAGLVEVRDGGAEPVYRLAPGAGPTPAFGLAWGIKGSFVAYVRRMPDGAAWIGDGAAPLDGEVVLFAPHAAGRRGAERFWEFRGDVRFRGHAGLLFVRVADPVLVAGPDGTAELTVADTSGPDREGERLTLVTARLAALPAPDGCERWAGTEVRVTPAGSALFGDVYPAGEEFDPFTLTVPLTEG